MDLTPVKCWCFCCLSPLLIQQEQFNLNEGKSLWNKEVSDPVIQQVLRLTLKPSAKPSRPSPYSNMCCYVPHVCECAVKITHVSPGFSRYCLTMERKYPSAWTHLSAEERQTTGILLFIPTVTETKYMTLSILLSFFFHFAHAWQAVGKLIFLLFTAMELFNTAEVQF